MRNNTETGECEGVEVHPGRTVKVRWEDGGEEEVTGAPGTKTGEKLSSDFRQKTI